MLTVTREAGYEERMRSYFAGIGLSNTVFNKGSVDHSSYYATGEFEGKAAGIIYGRRGSDYEYEAEGLSKLSHPGIPQCYKVGALDIPQFPNLPQGGARRIKYMIVSHFDATPIKNHVDFSSEDGRAKTVSVLLGLVDILNYCHSRGIVHEDIIEDHVLVNASGKVHLIDFHIWNKALYPAADFCGWSRLPEKMRDKLCDDPLWSYGDKVAWEPRGFGPMLANLLPSQDSNKFVEKLRDISRYLTSQPEGFIEDPNFRDIISLSLKRELEALIR